MKAECGYPLYWRGCYRGTYDLWGPESYSHPAKMSVALSFRILEHLQELGLLKDGDKILDPMAGIGTTNIVAGAMGYSSISVELEEKFVGFQKQNKEYAEKRLFKSLDWQMLQGDSRKLSELLQGQGLVSVTSPPFGDMNHPTNYLGREKRESCFEYSDNPNNIGNLRDTPLKSITSPPYGEALSGGGIAQYGHYSDPDLAKRIYSAENSNPEERSNIEKQIERVKQGRAKMKRPDVFTSEGNKAAKGYFEGNYSRNPENIGNLKDTPLKAITSPPYGDNQEKGGGIDWEKAGRLDRLEPSDKRHNVDGLNPDGYGEAEGQIGKLPDKPLKSVMSPPYESHPSASNSDLHPERQQSKPAGRQYGNSPGQIGNLKSVVSPPYGDALGDWKNKDSNLPGQYYGNGYKNIGNLPEPTEGNTKADWWRKKIAGEAPESYLEAMSQVYAEIAKVSDVLAVVVKNPTRGGKLRRLDLDTIAILKQSGWEIHCQHRALLFEELEQGDLFGGSKKQVKGRLSFFKRLSWQNGNPVASWEDIIIATRK